MARRIMLRSLIAVLLLGAGGAPGTAAAFHPNTVHCSFVRALQANITRLAAVVRDTPHLSPQQARQQADRVRLRQMSLEMGNTRQVVPKQLDGTIISVLSAVQQAARSRAAHKTSDYRRYLDKARRGMSATWSLFRHFQARQRCG